MAARRRWWSRPVRELFPCDALYAFHNEPPGFTRPGQFDFRSGVMYSSSDTIITIRGKGGRGAMPHVAVDPIVVASASVLALQTSATLARDRPFQRHGRGHHRCHPCGL